MESILDQILSFDDSIKAPNVSANMTIHFDGADDVEQSEIEDDLKEIGKAEIQELQNDCLYPINFDSFMSVFLRCSYRNKVKCLYRMLQKLNDESYLDLILLSSNFRMDKMRVYSQSLPNTNYIYDIKLNDHSRGLERGFLEETLVMYINWFEKLSAHEQIETLVDILKRAGAALIDKFYDMALKIKKARKVDKPKEEDIQDILTDNLFIYSKVGSQQDIYKNPLVIEIEKRKKTFMEALTKYNNQIMGITEKSPRSAKKSGKGDKSPKRSEKKSSKSSKKTRKASKKSNKNSKVSLTSSKSKDKKVRDRQESRDVNIVDQIQQLPIWIVKNIFNYLDQKTLKKLRVVNSYWAYVIDEVSKDRSCRKYMDKVIKKMERNMRYRVPDNSSKPKRRPLKLSIRQRRMKKLVARGTIHPKLRTTNNNKVMYPTLLEKATRKGGFALATSMKGYESFPRSIPNNRLLLATPTCVLNELGKQPYSTQENISTKANAITSESELTDEGQKNVR